MKPACANSVTICRDNQTKVVAEIASKPAAVWGGLPERMTVKLVEPLREPVKSVGVVGDARRYELVIVPPAVEAIDFVTARWTHLPYEFIERVPNRIITELAAVPQLVYDVSRKPPATI